MGSKCDALTRGSDTEAVFGEAASSPMAFWECRAVVAHSRRECCPCYPGTLLVA